MPKIATAKKKPSEKEASGDGDGFEAISSVGFSESTILTCKRRVQGQQEQNLRLQGPRRRVLKLQLPHERSLPAQRLVEENAHLSRPKKYWQNKLFL
jgi:hypothetical protein